MCLINVVHEHFITQKGKNQNQDLKILGGRGLGGMRTNIWGLGPTAEKNKYPQASKLKTKVTTWW